MSATITDRNGTEVTVYVAIQGRVVDAIVRADTREDFEAAALSRNLLTEDADGNRTPAPGVNIDVLGPVTIKPAVLDEEGNVTTPAVTDSRYHVNIRITDPALSVVDAEGFENWRQTAIDWTAYGTPDTAINAEEQGLKLGGVVLIDPATVKSPVRVWA